MMYGSVPKAHHNGCKKKKKKVEVGWGVCKRAGTGVAAHAPGGRGVFAKLRLTTVEISLVSPEDL
jgi:hypothetical protein